MKSKCDEWSALVGTLTPEEEQEIYNQANEAWETYLANAIVVGGAPANMPADDLTMEVLKGNKNFERTEATKNSGRFGAPKHWTVENYGFGTQAGLDNYSGTDCLHLEVWWNANLFTENGYDITNTRIYQLVELTAGLYYFGATYDPADYNDNMYIMATSALTSTTDIPTQSIAYERVTLAGADKPMRGITFRLEEDQQVYLGFQADLSSSATTNLRVSEVKLLKYSEMTYSRLESLIAEVAEGIARLKVNNNTGYYSVEAYELVVDIMNEAKLLDNKSSVESLTAAYEALSEAYNDLINNGRNKGGVYDATDATDITAQYLIEESNFTRASGGADRFGSPQYWTVENYNIRSNTEGVRGGLDRWPGTDHLTLGVWDDKQNASAEVDITNARVYRLVELPAGSYFFGATYNTIYNLGESYMFASTEALATNSIPTGAIAYMRIQECASDGQFWGIRFTLDEPQSILLGWQADLLNSSNTQEFRVAKVKLATYTDLDSDIECIEQSGEERPLTIYTIQGVRINAPLSALSRGVYIVNGKKVIF